MRVRFGGDDCVLLTLLSALAVFLYLQGSPVEVFEDQVHAGIVRRLAHLDHPYLNNLYVAPDIVYTYPFPSTHYFMALIARLGDSDALFVYHKLRFFWGPLALVMVYSAARAVFGTTAIASATAVTATVFAATGVFGMVEGFSWGWGQLVPYSHAADVAMNVLLPALLAMAFGYLMAQSARERTFLLSATVMLVFMLTVVHIREIIQFTVYLACFLAAAAGVRSFRPQVRRAALLLPLTLVTAGLYVLWQGRTAALVADIVGQQRARIAEMAASASLADLLFTPAPSMLEDFILNPDQVFTGLFPFLLFIGPPVVLLFHRRPLVWLIAASTLAYLLVMRVPLLALPYIYVTYHEILFTPVRNIVFFTYLLTGALVYVTVVALARFDRTRLGLIASGTVLGAIAVLASLYVNHSDRGFFAPLVAAYAITFMFLPRQRQSPLPSRIAVALAIVVGLVALPAIIPERRPPEPSAGVNVRWTERLPEAERASLEQQFSLTGGMPARNNEQVNVWSYRLNDLSAGNVSALVKHPNVVDTHNIDRSTFRAVVDPPRTAHPFFGVTHFNWLQYPGVALTVLAAVVTVALGLLVPAAVAWRGNGRSSTALEAMSHESFYRRAVPYALFMIPFALLSLRPTLTPLTLSPLPPFGRADTPRAMIGQTPCVDTNRMSVPPVENITGEGPLLAAAGPGCPPTYDLMQWIRERVPVDAIFAINRWNPYLPSAFIPQQVVMFPPVERSSAQERELFKTYYDLFDARVRKYRVQPFFNSVESVAERIEFLEALRVTHVLVDPASYDDMHKALEPLSGLLERRYAAGQWAVYEVKRSASTGSTALAYADGKMAALQPLASGTEQ